MQSEIVFRDCYTISTEFLELVRENFYRNWTKYSKNLASLKFWQGIFINTSRNSFIKFYESSYRSSSRDWFRNFYMDCFRKYHRISFTDLPRIYSEIFFRHWFRNFFRNSSSKFIKKLFMITLYGLHQKLLPVFLQGFFQKFFYQFHQIFPLKNLPGNSPEIPLQIILLL